MGGGSWWKVRAGCTLFLGEISQVRCSGAKRVTGQKGRGLRGSEGRGYVLFFLNLFYLYVQFSLYNLSQFKM